MCPKSKYDILTIVASVNKSESFKFYIMAEFYSQASSGSMFNYANEERWVFAEMTIIHIDM